MDDNDCTVTDESDGQPVTTSTPQPQHVDAAAVARETAKALMAELAPLLQQRAEPAQPAKPASTRDKMLAALKQNLGLDDTEAEEYARAAAYSLVEDEYEDEGVRKGLRQRTLDRCPSSHCAGGPCDRGNPCPPRRAGALPDPTIASAGRIGESRAHTSPIKN